MADEQKKEGGKDVFIIYAPQKTEALLKENGDMYDNYHLMLNRFPCYKKEFIKKNPLRSKESYLSFLRHKHKESNKISPTTTLLPSLNQQTANLAHSFAGGGCYRYKPSGRLKMGVASHYNNENLIALHSLYGVPYIPASGIKGALRNCWINENFDSEKEALSSRVFTSLFGTAGEGDLPPRRGGLVFFDAFPDASQGCTLMYDVQTPHYFDYYTSAGNTEPTDDIAPKPLPFLCVSRGVFDIYIACDDKAFWDVHERKIGEMMGTLFSTYGLGGKTALGYGLM